MTGSRIYFPLRSSVEFFEESAEVDPTTRVKAAAVLFEEVTLEAGQIIVSVGDSMNLVIHRPRPDLTDHDLTDARPSAGPGEEVELLIGVDSPSGKEMRKIGDSVVQRAYVAQWHTAAIDELEALQVPWASLATPSQDTIERIEGMKRHVIDELIGRATGDELSEQQATYAAESLAGDALLAARLGATISVSPMFLPFAGTGEVEPVVTGSDALSLLIPDLRRLTWESIADYRERPGSVEARGLLRGFEEAAIKQEPGDAVDYLEKVSGEITGALLGSLSDTEVNIPKTIAREAATVAAGFVPIVGPGIGAAAGVAEAIGRRIEQRESGVLALATLRRQT